MNTVEEEVKALKEIANFHAPDMRTCITPKMIRFFTWSCLPQGNGMWVTGPNFTVCFSKRYLSHSPKGGPIFTGLIDISHFSDIHMDFEYGSLTVPGIPVAAVQDYAFEVPDDAPYSVVLALKQRAQEIHEEKIKPKTNAPVYYYASTSSTSSSSVTLDGATYIMSYTYGR